MKVWLGRQNAPELMGGLPPGVDMVDWDGASEPPSELFDVEFYVNGFDNSERVLEVIPDLKKVRVVHVVTAGYDRIYDLVPEGAILCNSRGVHDPSTAEWVAAATLFSIREFPEFVLEQAARVQRHRRSDVLAGKTVVIFGYGSIGAAVERRLKGFDIEVIRVASRARDDIYGPESLPDILPRAEVLITLVPSSPETHHIVDAAFLAQLPDGALLVNAARGAIVDQDALLAEVRSGRIRAALDVGSPDPLPVDHPLLSTPGVFYTPHQGGHTRLDIPSAYAYIGGQLRRYVAGEPLENIVKQ